MEGNQKPGSICVNFSDFQIELKHRRASQIRDPGSNARTALLNSRARLGSLAPHDFLALPGLNRGWSGLPRPMPSVPSSISCAVADDDVPVRGVLFQLR